MKTKITFLNFPTVVIALLLLTGLNVKAQTVVYDETTSSGMFFQGNGAEVSNPLSDGVNSSANVAQSGTGGSWQQIQYFPTFTPSTGDKLFFSVYDPSNVGTAQVKFEYTSNPGVWVDGGDVGYVSGTNTGWKEQSISLDANAGNEINKIILMPGYSTSNAVYVDNIYVHSESTMSPASSPTVVYDETTSSGMFFQGNGAEVSNPLSDGVNSSANVAQSGTGGSWQQIQYFPTFTPSTGDKLFFSVYDPSNVGTAQVKFEYTSNPGVWVDGGDVGYVSGTNTGWKEQSISLDANAGNEINKIILMPGYSTSNAVYVDNIYVHSESTMSPASSPTVVYDETTSSGMFFQGNGAEVSNPLSDGVNSSANVAQSGTGGSWQQIQYFPTFTPSTGDKLFFSVYDPSNVGTAQVKFEYTSNPGVWVDGGDVGYVSGTNTGWKEQSISLDANAGNEINKIILMPGYSSSNAVYLDNIYFATSSTLSTNSVAKINNRVFVSKEGRIQFNKEQNNSLLSVYDLMGRLILEEKINGKKGEKVLNNKGVYILRVKSVNGVSSQKIAFY